MPVTVVFVNDTGPALAVRPKTRPVPGEAPAEGSEASQAPAAGEGGEPVPFEVEPQVQAEAPLLSDAEADAAPIPHRPARRTRRKAARRQGARPPASSRRARLARARRKAAKRRPS